MRGIKYLFAVFGMLLLVSCQVRLERPGIPIHWGFRMPLEDAPDSWKANFDYIGQEEAIMVELPVFADSSGMPRISTTGLEDLAQAALDYQTPLTLALCTTNPKELFPAGDFSEDESASWFAAYAAEVEGVLAYFQAHPPVRLILGNDWLLVEEYASNWNALLEGLRLGHPYLRLGYGSDLVAGYPEWWRNCDFLAVEYMVIADPNPKRLAMQQNPIYGQAGLDLDRPLLIYQSNLMGPDKAILLQNQLRFWEDEVEVEGLFINTLYARIPALDSSSYFGVQNDQAFWDFLAEYK